MPQWGLFAIGAAVFAALATIFAKVGVEGVSSNLATAIRTGVVLILAWSIVTATGEAGGIGTIAPRTWLFLILSSVATGLSWICYFRALQIGDATPVAAVDKLSVALILVFALLFLGEPFRWQTALGTGLIVAGTLVVLR